MRDKNLTMEIRRQGGIPGGGLTHQNLGRIPMTACALPRSRLGLASRLTIAGKGAVIASPLSTPNVIEIMRGTVKI